MARSLETREVELNDAVPAQVVGAVGPPQGLRLRPRDTSEVDDSYRDDLDGVEQQPLSENERRWGLYIILASVGDLFGSAVIFCTAFKYAYRDNGVSLYSLGFQAVSHWISSLLLFLRFVVELRARSRANTSLLRDDRRTQLYREQGLSIVMALVMLISSCALMFKAFRKLRFWHVWYSDMQLKKMDDEVTEITAWLAWVGFVIYVLQAVVRFVSMWKVNVGTLSHGCVASFVSLTYLLVLGIAASYEREWSWKAEPIAAIVLVIVTMAEGVRIIYYYIDDMDARLRHDPMA